MARGRGQLIHLFTTLPNPISSHLRSEGFHDGQYWRSEVARTPIRRPCLPSTYVMGRWYEKGHGRHGIRFTTWRNELFSALIAFAVT